jgi:sodium/bile acid cotransporter 7
MSLQSSDTTITVVVPLEDDVDKTTQAPTARSPSTETVSTKLPWWRRVLRVLIDQWFPIALISCVGISYGLKDFGSKHGPLHPSETTLGLIVVIFLLSGLSTDARSMLAGLKHWKLLLVAQLMSLLFAPLFMLAVTSALRGHVNDGILDGAVLVSVVPTTISSAYVLSVEMGGSTGPALVQCTFGNFIGVFISPGWLLLLLSNSDNAAANAHDGSAATSTSSQIGQSLLTLSCTVMLPLVVGMVIRRVGGERVVALNKKLKSVVGFVNKFSLFLIVFFAFCESFASGAFAELSGADLATSAALCVGLHAVLLGLALLISMRFLKFSRPDVVAVTLCSAQKTLALAMPLLALFFKPSTAGLVAVPILMYHPMQVTLGGVATVRVRKWVDAAAPPPDTELKETAAETEENKTANGDNDGDDDVDTSALLAGENEQPSSGDETNNKAQR